ncbi:DUF664 domain-containing protein [Nocardioides anomalus]|uniref:DUF664 domain-containing protein n=1 Tax=Nocardioides anomalus TaxID=2712223 RepID=A0A6G6WG98_9ACTN|nr:DinB family protein [Nocardioides anomalus]QIG44371.1 DUF664 domain-containing protein [Nocardioides anomalus]
MTESQREVVPRVAGTEKEIALSFLRFARHCLVKKTEGLDEEQLRRRLVGSETTLLGLVQHVTAGERWWFGHHVAGEPRWADVDFAMVVSEDRSPAEVFAAFDAAVAASEEIMARADLDDPLRVLVDGHQLSVRWAVAHTTSEIARHAGHADVLRELVDGVTGR